MIEPASLIGFALAFLVSSWLGSLLLGGLVLLGRRRLRASGPAAERRAAACAILLPPLLGLAITVLLAGYSVGGPWFGLEDHCPEHLHHLHLCLFHGAAWSTQLWAVTSLSVFGAVAGVPITRHVAALWRARVALGRVARISRRLPSADGEILLAPANVPFCFTAGLLRPRVFVSTAAWERLDDEERRAMLAHERAHADQGDVWRRSVLGGFALLGAPIVPARLLSVWTRATERLCDHRAAVSVGDPEWVARALVNLSLAHGARPPLAGAACFVPAEHEVVDRVQAVLAGEGDGRLVGRRIGVAAAILVASVLLVATIMAAPIHHALESLLGSV